MSQANRTSADRPDPVAAPDSPPALRRIGDALSGLRFGSVLAIVQDGVVVQIERTEKTRLDKTDR
ncbi:DUF2292 domain-containing protein [bacterium]|nr:DUF2292 domain-containing protein [bacterium]